MTKQYQALLNYVTRNIFDGDESAAEMLCEDVQGICRFDFSMQEIFEVFNTRGMDFQSEKQVNEVMRLVTELANHKLAETILAPAAAERNIRSVVWVRMGIIKF